MPSGDEFDDDGDENWELDNVQGGCGGDYCDGSGIAGSEDGDDGIVSGDGSDDNEDENDDNVSLSSRKKNESKYKY